MKHVPNHQPDIGFILLGETKLHCLQNTRPPFFPRAGYRWESVDPGCFGTLDKQKILTDSRVPELLDKGQILAFQHHGRA